MMAAGKSGEDGKFAVSNETVLITGGAGYIGSHTVLAFIEAGYRVVVLDDLSTGRRAAVADEAVFAKGDAGDGALVEALIREHNIGFVVHFAGSIVVSESVADPLKYYRNNTSASRNLIEACVAGGLGGGAGRFVFSSSAAVYGTPDRIPIVEDSPTAPINPYGASKLMTEWMLRDAAAAHGLDYVALRYFNVAGADPRGRTGETPPVATHLVKIACEVAVGKRRYVEVFGEDYDTPDGTCIRDYIHVSDLAAAHVHALEGLRKGSGCMTLNCGYGHGFSVREVLAAVEREAGLSLDIRSAARRAGDPPVLIADSRAIGAALGWQPQYDDLGVIVRTALAWERKLAAEIA